MANPAKPQRTYKCGICEKEDFKSPYELRKHRDDAHPNAKKTRKPRRSKGASVTPVVLNFCPHCGNRLPNAHVEVR